ncbi:MAG: diguanylate cyclase [Nitrospirae bacterium]|nr:diguanylate cyclase [Nitrospirota bacterium]
MEEKPRIIIVDDDESLLDVLKRYLAMQGHDCEVFSSAKAALDHLAEKPCDILLTDIVMQGMKGLQLTKQVKLSWPNTNVIVMTGFIDDYSYDQAIDAGASDFIKKPFSVHEIMLRIKHVMLQAKLREMSITDELTGLLNRRGFFAIAQQQLKVAKRVKGKLTLVFADMDNFKSINDKWGHHKGDEALVAMAEIFRQSFRDSDLIARISGDEFALLLLDTHEENFNIIFKRLQNNIDAFNGRSGEILFLSLSIGMALYDYRRPCSIDELLRLADERMYDNKKQKKKIGLL